MKVKGGGFIINFSLIFYMMGNVGYLFYMIVNFGINGMICSFVCEFGFEKICVNVIVLGWVLMDK